MKATPVISFTVPASDIVALKVVNPVPLEVNDGCANTPSPINVSTGASAVSVSYTHLTLPTNREV